MIKTMFLRRLTVFLCLVAVLLAAVSPSASGALPAWLVTAFFCFIAVVVIVSLARLDEAAFLPASPLIAVVSSRAPPCA